MRFEFWCNEMAKPKRVKKQERDRRVARARPNLAGRRRFVLALYALVALGLATAAVWRHLPLVDGERDRFFGRAQVSSEPIAVHRGLIKDRRDHVLAASIPALSLAANPGLLLGEAADKAEAEKVEEQADVLADLAKALGMEVDRLRQRLADRIDRGFVFLQRRMDQERSDAVAEVIATHKLRGAWLDREYRRYYPGGEAFAHVLGYTDVDDRGQEGLELVFDARLVGKPGRRHLVRDGKRRLVGDLGVDPQPKPGEDLQLSIDRRLQLLAFRELLAGVNEHAAKAASLVMLDPRTGEVLAMVNLPAYNPNRNRGGVGEARRNRAVTDVFEPGSTLKPMAVAAALELTDSWTPDSTIDTAPGFLKLGGFSIKDHENLGRIDVRTLLQKSSNVGAAKLAMSLPAEGFWQVLRGFGLGEASGSYFPGEKPGALRLHIDWRPVDQAALGYGYGVGVTALQLARAYAVLAADGVRHPVSFLRQDGRNGATRVLSAATAKTVRAMLTSVVRPGGTGTRAAVRGYSIAGKTGTARIANRDGYQKNRYTAAFAGMAPAGRPRLVAVVVVSEPNRGQYYGGQVAAPIFGRVMRQALRILNVPPDDALHYQPRSGPILARQEPLQ